MSIEIDQGTIQIVTQFFFPGYLSLVVFLHLTGKKTGKDVAIFVALAIGFILNFLSYSLRIMLRETFLQKTILSTLNRDAVNLTVSVVIGVSSALILAAINNSNWFSKAMIKVFNKSPNEDIWFDVIDFKLGASAKIYEKGGNGYIGGNIRHIEKDGDETWIALSGYWKQEVGKSLQDVENHIKNPEDYYVQKLSNIEHIELFNNTTSKRHCSLHLKKKKE